MAPLEVQRNGFRHFRQKACGMSLLNRKPNFVCKFALNVVNWRPAT
jgi:hypothetical protein